MNANYETKRIALTEQNNNNETEDSRVEEAAGDRAGVQAVPHKYAKQLKDSRRSNLGVKCE